jgi:hypothetical protein
MKRKRDFILFIVSAFIFKVFIMKTNGFKLISGFFFEIALFFKKYLSK